MNTIRGPGGTRFPAHGRIAAHPVGRIVYFDSTGPFNIEAVAAMREAYTPVMTAMAVDGAFGHVTVFHGSMLATPEALAALAALLAEWRSAGIMPVANAYVAGPEVEGRDLVLPHYAAAFGPSSPLRLFDGLADAKVWVEAALAGTA